MRTITTSPDVVRLEMRGLRNPVEARPARKNLFQEKAAPTVMTARTARLTTMSDMRDFLGSSVGGDTAAELETAIGEEAEPDGLGVTAEPVAKLCEPVSP